MVIKRLRSALARRLTTTRIHEIPIFFGDPDIDRHALSTSLADAMAFMHREDVRRYRLVQRYVEHVFVWPGHYNAANSVGGILLSSPIAQEASRAELVGTLVHEATHLRIQALGVRYVGDKRARIERLCLSEEVDCLVRCGLVSPKGGATIMESLATEWWSDAATRSDLERIVHTAGLPTWMSSLFLRLSLSACERVRREADHTWRSTPPPL